MRPPRDDSRALGNVDSIGDQAANENTNGLIRDFFPKGTDFSTIANAEVAKVERLLNARPRKSLGFRSPGGCTGQLGDFGQFGFALDQSEQAAFASSAASSLKWQRLGPYEKFAVMIDRHWDGIAAYCRPENKVSLGFVVLNNKIRVIQRRAYGLADENYLRLKTLTCMLPPL